MSNEPEQGVNEMCPACGAAPRRAGARFCATCGRSFEERGYVPADAIRSSYHFQSLPPAAPRQQAAAVSPPRRAAEVRRRRPARRVVRAPFWENENGAAKTALAFVTYALVPYLGILFCPGALLMGGVGLARVRRAPYLGGRRAALLSLALGLLILAAQLFLWWLLYKVPEWTQQR